MVRYFARRYNVNPLRYIGAEQMRSEAVHFFSRTVSLWCCPLSPPISAISLTITLTRSSGIYWASMCYQLNWTDQVSKGGENARARFISVVSVEAAVYRPRYLLSRKHQQKCSRGVKEEIFLPSIESSQKCRNILTPIRLIFSLSCRSSRSLLLIQ